MFYIQNDKTVLKFSITTLPERIYDDKYHMCAITMEMAHPIVNNTMTCLHYFKASRKYNSTCSYVGKL